MSQGFIYEDFTAIVMSITDDGNGVVSVDNTDPFHPVVKFDGVYVDGVTVTGDGSAGNPLTAVTSPSFEFPVGYVYTSVDSTDPAIVLGYGTWQQFAQGRVLVGVDITDPDFDTVEETGGEKKHVLTCEEVPDCNDLDPFEDIYLLMGA